MNSEVVVLFVVVVLVVVVVVVVVVAVVVALAVLTFCQYISRLRHVEAATLQPMGP